MIKVNNISKKYGHYYAVKDLSFDIEKGQIYGFLGPNGAGKSTTMNIMTGYIAATSGSVEIDGHDIVTDAIEAKKCVGYLPEIPPLYLDMTVLEYLTFVASLKGIDKSNKAKKIEEIMEKTFIDDMSNRLIKNLSKGYKQRVGLAGALLGDPQYIILDEPTVGLDPNQINETRALIRNLKEDHAVILSSHILSEIAEVCDHIIIIAQGHIIIQGSAEKIMADGMSLEQAFLKYTDREFVKEYISSLEPESDEITEDESLDGDNDEKNHNEKKRKKKSSKSVVKQKEYEKEDSADQCDEVEDAQDDKEEE